MGSSKAGPCQGTITRPSVKRLAMLVEDHPMTTATSRVSSPRGITGREGHRLDEGTYTPYQSEGREEDEQALAVALRKGDLKFTLEGQKLKGNSPW